MIPETTSTTSLHLAQDQLYNVVSAKPKGLGNIDINEVSVLIHIINPDNTQLEQQFQELAEKWRNETAGSSSPIEIIANENYLLIIKLGVQHKEIITPMILNELRKKANYWFEALKLITDENPVTEEEFSSYKLVTKAWLNWGKQKGYL